MPFIKTLCPQCNKPFESEKTFVIGNKTVHFGKCKHILQASQLEKRDASSVISLKGHTPYPFQVKTVTHMEESSGRDLVAHEMGLGKTICACAFLALHPECHKFLIVAKKNLLIQWQHELMNWLGEDVFCQIIDDSKTPLLPGASGWIISYDLIRRLKNFKERLQEVGARTLFLDECQQIKNLESQRTREVMELSKQFEYVFPLSGTPIKNNAEEYFPTLNIVAPQVFNNFSQFQRWWCDSYWDGFKYKSGGLRFPEEFQEKTRKFIIRFERKEVKDEIGLNSTEAIRRFSFHELSKEVEQAYKATFKQFQNDFYSGNGSNSFEESGNILAYLSKMRHLAGLSLIDPVIDHVCEFLESTDRKLAIFVHHKDVGSILKMRLDKVLTDLELPETLQLTSDMTAEQRSDAVTKFNETPRAVMILSTLASGEGLNLQTCSDCIMMERQWNPANEEQAESRFIRIGQKASEVTATYFIAVGTVVEFFSEIVERKREIVSKTLSGQAAKWDQSSLMKELSEVLASSGGKRWGW